ncbi:MAG: serine hydrolase [Halobacteriovorax sp.]|nr:serine hydrolase [Halobacteriovorax sp.]|tara:strand:+ start:50988 stop:52067 length:1080 start_codon:yes stop_codon:yes gene_type:complete
MKTLLLFFIIFQAHGASHKWSYADPSTKGVDPVKWNKFLEFARDTKSGHSTNALFIYYDGAVIHHSTYNGFKKNQPHRQWSISKSFTSALVGIAVQKKIIDIETPVKKFYSLHKNTKFGPTLKDLLGMSSGLDWNEGYEGSPLKSNVIAMLYTEGFNDMATYTASRPSKSIPGEKFYYSSGETNLIMGMLKKSLGINDYASFPWTALFDPLGIKTATWEKDQSGTFVGSSYLYMSPEDLAKFGLLYLKKGKFLGKKILDPEWVEFSHTLAPPFYKMKIEGKEKVETYGAQWWLNLDLPGKKNTRSYPGFPTDAYMALGHHGQILAIVPSKKLIIVRNGADKDERLDKIKFFKLLVEALP